MSIKALNWAIHEADITNPLKKWMLVCLADFHNQETCQFNPSISTLLKMSKMKRSTVYQYLKELETEGVITKDTTFRENGSQTTNYYYLNMDGVHQLDPPVHELDPLNQYTNINIVNKENIVNNVDVVNVPEMEIWEEALSQDSRWKPFATERLRRDWINSKKSEAEQYGIDLVQVADDVLNNLKNDDAPNRNVRKTFATFMVFAKPKPPTGNASHSNQDKYTQAKSDLGG